jgi:hypothetical protein
MTRGDARTTSLTWKPAGMLRGSGASSGDTRCHNGSTITMGDSRKCTIDGGMAGQLQWVMMVAMGDGRCHNGRQGQWWHDPNGRQWWWCNGWQDGSDSAWQLS